MMMSFGLSNFSSPLESNICFLNAILHLLYSVTLIRTFVQKKGYKAQDSCAVTPIFDEISRIFNYGGAVTTAGPLRQLLGSKDDLRYLLSQKQEDAEELLNKLLEHMSSETDPDVNLKDLLQISVAHQSGFDTADSCCRTCGYSSPPHEDSRNILVLAGNSGLETLQGLIDAYFEDKVIEWRCGNDGHCRDADLRIPQPGKQRQMATKLPEVLFLQVPNKNVNSQCDEGVFSIQDVKYEIVGVVDHYGDNVNSGHYVAWTKLESQWFECDDGSIPIPDLREKHFSVHNYIFVGVKLDETDGVKQRCSICGGSFNSLLTHLQRSKFSCRKFFDLEAMKKEKALKSNEKRNMSKRQARADPVKKKIENDRDALRKAKNRENPVKKETENVQNALRMADNRKGNFEKKNKTATGRKRIFLDSIRDGCSYPCVCCHENKYSNGVHNIADMAKLKDQLDSEFKDLFHDTILPVSELREEDLENIPNRKGRFFICTNCKGKLFSGKMPAKCRRNNLEIFDIRNHPDLDLTELELNLISKRIIFMKIHRKPKSLMSAIKDRVVCIPIDSGTINETLQKLPRLPKDAGLVPIKLKRKQSYKQSHLQEWVDIEKVHRCLLLLKNFGHKEYQFYTPEDWESYVSRCQDQDAEGFEMLFDPDEFEMSIDEGDYEDDLENIEEIKTEEDVEKQKLETPPLDPIEYAEKMDEDFLLNDPCAKFQFSYDRAACFVNDCPESRVKTHNTNEAISVSPGEGEICI